MPKGEQNASPRPPAESGGDGSDAVLAGRDIIRRECDTLVDLADRLGESFARAVELILDQQGAVIVSGMGKAGLIGQKIAATLASTGTRAHFLHPAEAIHGDLGRIHTEDLVLLLSQSGETEEISRLLTPLQELGSKIVAITSDHNSRLGHAADVTIELGPIREAGELALAPSSSTTAMLALGDALALVVSEAREFGPDDFARFHPGGSLGRKLSIVDDYMRPLEDCRLADENETVRSVLMKDQGRVRRTGAVMLLDTEGRLSGLFTDSDLARLFERRADDALDRPITEVMTPRPFAVRLGTRMRDAVGLLARHKISELPILDKEDQPVGILDVTDIVAQFPEWKREWDAAERTSYEGNGAPLKPLRVFDPQDQ